jgi:hypothetical protein
MAKLGARGRTELARVVKTDFSNDADIASVTHRYALMSDQNILKRVTTQWRNHPASDRGWKVIEKYRYPTTPDAFLEFFEKLGYTKEEK